VHAARSARYTAAMNQFRSSGRRGFSAMAFHQVIQGVLLIGAKVDPPAPPAKSQPPLRLIPLIDAIAPAHEAFNARALHYGHRYRSGFWAIYLLSAIAVLCAIMPLALGWDDRSHAMHPFAGAWAFTEVCIIAAVSLIYWLGQRHDWQGVWLHTRTTAELTWYLPLVAPLIDFTREAAGVNWYLRVFDPDKHPRAADEVASLCAHNDTLAREMLANAWSDPAFVANYARWTIEILEGQKHYHRHVAIKQHALLHRVHRLNGWLFGLTALAALLHLVLHTLWLSLVTTFFPALGASLHGALAQSESYRLSISSERLVEELRSAIDRLRSTVDSGGPLPSAAAIKELIGDAVALILEEHEDWQMLVRTHRLPLA
jgi:hypothetical protein